MRGSVLKNMRRADVFGRLIHRHLLPVDITRPDVADTLLAFKIVCGHLFHGDRCVLKVLYLPAVRIPVFETGIKNNEDKDSGHDDHIDEYYYESFQALGGFHHVSFKYF